LQKIDKRAGYPVGSCLLKADMPQSAASSVFARLIRRWWVERNCLARVSGCSCGYLAPTSSDGAKVPTTVLWVTHAPNCH